MVGVGFIDVRKGALRRRGASQHTRNDLANAEVSSSFGGFHVPCFMIENISLLATVLNLSHGGRPVAPVFAAYVDDLYVNMPANVDSGQYHPRVEEATARASGVRVHIHWLIGGMNSDKPRSDEHGTKAGLHPSLTPLV